MYSDTGKDPSIVIIQITYGIKEHLTGNKCNYLGKEYVVYKILCEFQRSRIDLEVHLHSIDPGKVGGPRYLSEPWDGASSISGGCCDIWIICCWRSAAAQARLLPDASRDLIRSKDSKGAPS